MNICKACFLNAFAFLLITETMAEDFCNTTTHSGTSVILSSNTVGKFDNGIGYELWNEGGQGGSATFYDDGSFNCQMTGAKDYLCRSGLSFNSDKTHEELGRMKADFKLVKNNLSGIDYSYIGIYGWTREPLVEWYIVDNTGSEWMPGDWVAQGSSAKKHGVFEIDGAKYTVYEGDRTSYSIDGDNTYFKQYFSVRTSKRDCGTIDITAHFKKWEELGLKLGKLHEAKILGEAGSNSGATAKGEYDFPYAKVYIENETAVSSSSSVSEISSSSETNAIYDTRLENLSDENLQVFDLQGKYLGIFKIEHNVHLETFLKSKVKNTGIYLVKRGNFIQKVSVK